MKSFFKVGIFSLQIILITAVLAIAYGFIRWGTFTLVYVFNTCFAVGLIILCVSLVKLILSFLSFKFDKLTDHSSFFVRYMEHREKNREKALEFLFLGILVILAAGLIQLLLAVVIQ